MTLEQKYTLLHETLEQLYEDAENNSSLSAEYVQEIIDEVFSRL
jgi:hypothetical protein